MTNRLGQLNARLPELLRPVDRQHDYLPAPKHLAADLRKLLLQLIVAGQREVRRPGRSQTDIASGQVAVVLNLQIEAGLLRETDWSALEYRIQGTSLVKAPFQLIRTPVDAAVLLKLQVRAVGQLDGQVSLFTFVITLSFFQR